MVKAGVAGLGFMGLTHLRAYQDHGGVELVAIADQVKERLEGKFSIQGNIQEAASSIDFTSLRGYESLEELVADPEVELISICLPTKFHASAVATALAGGKHVLCEKPMGLTHEDLDLILEAAKSSTGRLMIAQCIRFWPDYQTARNIIKDGSLGKVLSARFERHSAMPGWGGWLADESMSGGVILDLSVHDIDYAMHLLGKPDRVSAIGAKNAESGLDHYQGFLHFGDVSVSISGGWYYKGEYPFSMAFDIFCEHGVLSMHSGQERPLTIYRADGSTETPKLAEGDGYNHEVEYFVRCIEEGKDPEKCPPVESADAVRIALLLRESRGQQGAIITV